MIKLVLPLLATGSLALLLTACPKAATSTGSSTPPTGGGPEASAAPFGDTMADAPLHHLGASFKAPAGCNTSGYARFDFPVGQAVKMDVAVEGPEGACLSISYLNANGGAVDGMMKVLCAGTNPSESWDIQGLEGGSFLQVSEQPPCKDASISISAN